MKKIIVFISSILIILTGITFAGEMTFEQFKNLVTEKVVPKGFKVNPSRTMNMRSSYRTEFKGDESKMEIISISLSKGKEDFTQIDKLGKPELYKYKGRSALYKDGKNFGMASFSLILKNKRGKLTISHRVFGGTFLDKAGFEKIVENIGLDKLEK